jgi:hypothetical protein
MAFRRTERCGKSGAVLASAVDEDGKVVANERHNCQSGDLILLQIKKLLITHSTNSGGTLRREAGLKLNGKFDKSVEVRNVVFLY